MSGVRLSRITKAFGGNRAVDEVSLEIGTGEFVTLLGPSGCGKTTTLRAIAGLVELDSGTVEIGGADVTRTPVNRRNIGMVFQSHALFPHMTVAQNVAFGLRMRQVPRREQQRRIEDALEMVHLASFGQRYPHQLSGGQQQRVALARALVISPSVLLLDEPFGALDRKLREAMQVELRNLTRRLGMTAVFVTHDQQEALVMSDRIAVMNDGRIEQLGTPAEVFDRPATRFVADFMGVENLLECESVTEEPGGLRVSTDGLSFTVASAGAPASGQAHLVAIRSERIRVSDHPEPDASISVAGIVEQAIYGGTNTSYAIRLEGAHRKVLSAIETNRRAISDGPRLETGARVWLSWDREAAHLVSKGGSL
jgi:spermidine/putrescine ABC transporter ATP-binding subunit